MVLDKEQVKELRELKFYAPCWLVSFIAYHALSQNLVGALCALCALFSGFMALLSGAALLTSVLSEKARTYATVAVAAAVPAGLAWLELIRDSRPTIDGFVSQQFSFVGALLYAGLCFISYSIAKGNDWRFPIKAYIVAAGLMCAVASGSFSGDPDDDSPSDGLTWREMLADKKSPEPFYRYMALVAISYAGLYGGAKKRREGRAG